MGAGLASRVAHAVAGRCSRFALVGCLAAALGAMVAGDAGAAISAPVATASWSKPRGVASTERRCRTVRVKLRRHGKVVRRNGNPVYRRVRRCKVVPSPGCRFVKVKKRKNGKVVKRKGRPVYKRVERCPPKSQPPAPDSGVQSGPSPEPGPTPQPGPSPGPGPGPGPQPGPPDELANQVLAMSQHVPGNIGLFTSAWENGPQGFYPAGSAMTPAGSAAPTEDEVRTQLTAYLNRWFGGNAARINDALALFDDPALKALVDGENPTLRAAIAAMKGTLLEPAIDHLFNGGVFNLVRLGFLPPSVIASVGQGGSPGTASVIVNRRYQFEGFEYLVGTIGHEILHDDFSTPRAEEAVLNTLTAMTYMQELSKTPDLAYRGTELTRQMNDLALLFINSREAGSPNSEIYAPTGLGVAPGSPRNEPDVWNIFDGGGSAPAPEPLRTILQNILTPGTPISDPLNYNQATAELFAGLSDNWLTDTQRAQISVLLQLVTVAEIAHTTGLGQQQIIDTLGLRPYLDAIS